MTIMCSAHISLKGTRSEADSGEPASRDESMTTRLENLLGAFGVAVSDSMDDAFDEACAVGDSAHACSSMIPPNMIGR